MRITNNMMLRNTSNNINGNKNNVNSMNNQMSSHKKIQRPSEDPVIAIRALRLRSNLSEIDQYYENNIPDAESWLSLTETAMKNMEALVKDVRTQCVYGATDSLSAEDRETILKDLQKLRDQIYAEGNTDYAGRTIFTGYRTNQKLTFMENDKSTKYNITQPLSFKDIEEHRYYSDKITVPKTPGEVTGNPISNPKESVFDRINLSYGEIGSIVDANGNTLYGKGDPNAVPPVPDARTGNISYNYLDANGVEQTDNVEVTVYETLEEWAAANGNEYKIDEGAGEQKAVFIKETGELILGDNASVTMRSRKADLELDYTKTGFNKGELRPEYYYNCTNVTDPANPVEFVKYNADGQVYQDINYKVSGNQLMTVNTEASAVFDASIGRDIDAMIEAVQFAMAANDKVAELKKMKDMQEYASDDCQAKLDEWIKAAQKEADYADDNMQKLYNSYIGNCDEYLDQINLALTDVGSKGKSLELTKNRMSNQQTTIETLKSKNEDREMSDIIIDYFSAIDAYQGSLQAAAKINQNTLLNFL